MSPQDDSQLMRAYSNYLTNPSQETYEHLKSHISNYCVHSPTCLRLLERFRNDWIFRVIFSRAQLGYGKFIIPSEITPTYYSSMLMWIVKEIRRIFTFCSCSNQSKFKIEIENISLLVKLAKKTSFEIKNLGITHGPVIEIEDLVVIWKYLIGNISIDFEHKTIDYYSLFRTFNEIIFFVKAGPSCR